MSVIRKQSIKGSTYAYLGAFVGFITRGYIFPHVLTEEQVGLFGVLLSVSVLLSQFSNLGYNNVGTRLFPYFRNKENKNNGYLFLGSAISVIGFLVCLGLFHIFETQIVNHYSENSKLFVDYIWYIFPLTFFTVFFGLFDAYSRVLYNSTSGTFLKEVVQRLLILFSVILFYFNVYDFDYFVIAFVISTSIPTLMLMWKIQRMGELSFRPNLSFITPSFRNQIIQVSLFGMLAGVSFVVISFIDTIMVNHILGLHETGIYTVAFFFGTIIVLPGRSLYRITTTVIADAWKENDLQKIAKIYSNSCTYQMLIGCFIFVGIWANIDNIFQILPPVYASGKFVIFWISLANVIEMLTGVNGVILGTSKHYRFDTLFMIILMILAVISNYLLIPVLGITGSGLATFISLLLFNFLRFWILFHYYGLQPYHKRNLLIIVISLIAYGAVSIIPINNNFIIDALIRSSVISIIFFILSYTFKISEELNAKFRELLTKAIHQAKRN